VIRAVLAAHPYEEVAYDVIELGDPGTAPTGMGRVGEIDETTLAVFADRVVGALPPTARGVLVGGDPDRVVRRVAVMGGAGQDLFADVLSSGAGVGVRGEGGTGSARREPLGRRVDLVARAGGAAR
jgi:putative NIF3 family GTP cyclohydrolase 1 type 2